MKHREMWMRAWSRGLALGLKRPGDYADGYMLGYLNGRKAGRAKPGFKRHFFKHMVCGYSGCLRQPDHLGMHWRPGDRRKKPEDVIRREQTRQQRVDIWNPTT